MARSSYEWLMPGSRRLVLHIGWPKTASTFFQRAVFKRDGRVQYIGKPRNKRETVRLKKFLHGRKFGWSSEIDHNYEPFLSMKNIAQDMPLIISSENLFTGTGKIIDGSGPDPKKVARGIQRVREFCGEDVDLRVLVCFRRQDEWLIANYAEQANRDEIGSQEGFEERIDRMFSSDAIDKSYLHYGEWLNEVVSRIGSGIMHPIIFEDLATRPAIIERSLGDVSGIEYEGWLAVEDREAKWARRQEAFEWRLRMPKEGPTGHLEKTVTLRSEVSRVIMKNCEKSNRWFAEQLGRSLDVYGYY